MSKRRVTDFFKPKVNVKSVREEKDSDEPPVKTSTVIVIQQQEESITVDKAFHPPKDFVFPKIR